MAFQPIYTAELNILGIALENMMICRVHRSVILGLLARPSPSGGGDHPPIMFTTGINSSDVLSLPLNKNVLELELRKRDSEARLQS